MREVNPYTTTLPYLATRMALNDYYAGESVSAFEKKLCGRVAKQACRKDTKDGSNNGAVNSCTSVKQWNLN